MQNKIIIYSTPTCPYCTMAKDFFTSKGLDYIEHDVAHDPQARQEMIEKTGQMGVPVIIVDNELVIGFDKPRLEEILH
jgi:glutaredoxin 3